MTGPEFVGQKLSDVERSALLDVNATVLFADLHNKYNRALQALRFNRSIYDSAVDDPASTFTPRSRFIRAVEGSLPLLHSADAFFAIRIDLPESDDSPLDEDVDEEPFKDILVDILQVDTEYGEILDGSEISVGSLLEDGSLKVNPMLDDIFTENDLSLILLTGHTQMVDGFTVQYFRSAH